MNKETLTGSCDIKGLFKAKNPNGISDTPDCVEFENNHPSLLTYTPSNELVTDVENVEVREGWRYNSPDTGWTICSDTTVVFKKACGYDVEQVYITTQAEQWQIKHTKGWSDISEAEYQTYKDTNATLRLKPLPEAQPLEGVKTAEEIEDIAFKWCLQNEREPGGVAYDSFIEGLKKGLEHHAQFATDAGGGKEFKGKRIDGNGYAYGNFFYWVRYGRKIPIIGIGIQNGSVMGDEVDPDTVTLTAPSTHSSSEMVENIKRLFMQWNHSYERIGLHHSFITQYPISDDNIRITTSTHDYVVFDAAGTWFLACIKFIDGEPNEEWTKQFNNQQEAKEYAENTLITQILTIKR